MGEGIPEGWKQASLGELAKTKRGITYDSSNLAEKGQGFLNYINMKSFLKDGGYNRNGEKYFDGDYAESNLLSQNDLVIANTDVTPNGDIIGAPALLPKDKEQTKSLFSHHVTALSLSSNVLKEFLYHLLCLGTYRQEMRKIARGTTVLMLDMDALRRIPISLPPKPEQQKIASILTSVDEVIEKTEAQISKLQDLKQGMMQEFLTKGIGHTEFKDSPVGRIPKGWDVARLETLLDDVKTPMRSGPFGSTLLKSELVPKGIPFLGIDNVHVEKFVKNYKRFVSKEKFLELQRYTVREDDVMITIMGTVGRSCVVPKRIGDALSSKHVWTMTFSKRKYLPELICWQLNYASWVLNQFKNESQGGVMDAISSNTLKNLLLPCPPIDEQTVISKSHTAISDAIETKNAKLDSLQNFKASLMQDLLTGKVRVKTDGQT